ncbi:hypothetical protein HHI36_015463, partial [Cryptolaemus montrouzieri]
FSESYLTDRPVPSSHYIAGSSITDEGPIAVPSISNTSSSMSSSIIDKVSIPDSHTISETPMLALQNPTAIIDQVTVATSSCTRTSNTECVAPSIIDDISNFLYEAESRVNLKTLENVQPPESDILPNLTPLSNLNIPSTPFAIPAQ